MSVEGLNRVVILIEWLSVFVVGDLAFESLLEGSKSPVKILM